MASARKSAIKIQTITCPAMITIWSASAKASTIATTSAIERGRMCITRSAGTVSHSIAIESDEARRERRPVSKHGR